MTSPRTPRQWNAGDTIPEFKVDRLRTPDGTEIQRRIDRDPLSRWWSVDLGGNRFGPDRLLVDFLSYYGELSEVLPEIPEPPQVGDRVIATQFGRAHETVEGVLEAPASPIDEPATVRRDDGIRIYILNVVKVVQARGHRGGCLGCEHDPAAYPPCWSEDEIGDDQSRRADWIRGTTRVPASQSVPAVPVSSTGGKEAGEDASEAQGAFERDLADILHDNPTLFVYADAQSTAARVMEHFLSAGWQPPLPHSETEVQWSVREQGDERFYYHPTTDEQDAREEASCREGNTLGKRQAWFGPWIEVTSPLSGEALRDVEERDDAAGDLP